MSSAWAWGGGKPASDSPMRTLVAVWDTGRSAWTVGKGLLFLEELNVLRRVHDCGNIRMLWCSDQDVPPLLTFADLPLTVERISDRSALQGGGACAASWGLTPVGSPCSFEESLLWLQKTCGPTLPVLSPRSAWCTAADVFLAPRRQGRVVVALHLKQHPTNTLSNAHLSEWAAWIDATDRDRYAFVVVGNEAPVPLLDMPHVYWTEGRDLCMDLAVIARSEAFLGMSSGLCQMAMFGGKPYTIFKHPEHHAVEMQQEFGGRAGFSFTNDRQNFRIAWDDRQVLAAAFAQLGTYV